jgi:hypothetical protein
MSTSNEHAHQAFQPESVLRWAVAPEIKIWTPGTEAASQAAQLIAHTFFPSTEEAEEQQADEQTADPLDTELFRVDPDTEETSVSIWTPLGTEPNSINFTFCPLTDGTTTIRVTRNNPPKVVERTAIDNILAGTDAVLLATKRSLDIDFPTGKSALDYLGSPDVGLPQEVIVNYVRRQAFSALMGGVCGYASGTTRAAATFPAEDAERVFDLVRRHAPSLSDDLDNLKNKIEAQGAETNDYSGTLFGLARRAYFDQQDEKKRVQFTEETAKLLRAFYKDKESEKDWPHRIAFHLNYDPAALSVARAGLHVPFAWTGELVDPRLSVAATLFVKGDYNLYNHRFDVNDSVTNSHTHIRLAIGRTADSPLHSEQELAPIMERQWKQLGGTALTSEQIREYEETFAQPAPPIDEAIPRSKLQVRSRSGKSMFIDRPFDGFFE